MSKNRRSKEFIHNHKQGSTQNEWDDLRRLGDTSWDDLSLDDKLKLDSLTRPADQKPLKDWEPIKTEFENNEVDLYSIGGDEFLENGYNQRIKEAQDREEAERQAEIQLTRNTILNWKKDLESRRVTSTPDNSVKLDELMDKASGESIDNKAELDDQSKLDEINEDKDPSKLEKAKEYWGKLGKKIGRFLNEHPKTRKAVKVFLGISAVGAVGAFSFMYGRSTVSANGQDSSNNNEPRTEHFTNNNQSNQNKSKYDSAINDVLENNKDAEKNLEGYSADKDIYETEKPQKEYLENFSASREGLSTDDYRKFLANEVSTNPIMMLTKLDHAGLIPEFLDHDGDGDITDDQLHEIADKMTKDPALFKKVQDFYKKAVENAIIGEETEIPGIFDSEYIIKDSNGMQRLAYARDLRIGGKMRSIKLRSKNTDGSLKEGKSYDERTNCSQGVTVKTGHNFNSWAPRGCEIQITPNTPTPDKPNNPGEETPPPTPDTSKDLEKKDWSKQKAGDEVTPRDKGEFREDNSTRSSELDYTYKATPQIGQETPNLGVDYGNTDNGQKAENQYNPSLEQQDTGVAGQSAEIDRQNQEAAARQAETDKAAENIQNPNRVTLADGTVIDLPPTN